MARKLGPPNSIWPGAVWSQTLRFHVTDLPGTPALEALVKSASAVLATLTTAAGTIVVGSVDADNRVPVTLILHAATTSGWKAGTVWISLYRTDLAELQSLRVRLGVPVKAI